MSVRAMRVVPAVAHLPKLLADVPTDRAETLKRDRPWVISNGSLRSASVVTCRWPPWLPRWRSRLSFRCLPRTSRGLRRW